jgi:hypothetical protein
LVVFSAVIVMSLGGAAASLVRGRRYVHTEVPAADNVASKAAA